MPRRHKVDFFLAGNFILAHYLVLMISASVILIFMAEFRIKKFLGKLKSKFLSNKNESTLEKKCEVKRIKITQLWNVIQVTFDLFDVRAHAIGQFPRIHPRCHVRSLRSITRRNLKRFCGGLRGFTGWQISDTNASRPYFINPPACILPHVSPL